MKETPEQQNTKLNSDHAVWWGAKYWGPWGVEVVRHSYMYSLGSCSCVVTAYKKINVSTKHIYIYSMVWILTIYCFKANWDQ